ncbi:uncharacterized protein LOC113869190 [Abrus precatorius]|uniref:Uncharacterized protein LOC113869190 n=1 Tax=Abrus precatorius TaxID=3816 RepID=A0A8B8LY57_ABRPR|nr:uncharacterized protein LOC113869190 [Abrus precatorius]
MFERLKDDAEKPLYNGCRKFTRLSSVLKLYNLKAMNGWTNKSFTKLLTLLNEMLLEDNVLPTRTYDAKQVLASIGLTHEKIHACPNDCILFRKEYASLSQCPKCNESRYIKNKSTPAKVMWYFPVILRLRRLFRTAENAKHMTWHAEGRIRDGKLRHPADSLQWKKFDDEYEDFAAETRNIRFALAIDGMNLHGMQSSTHSTWPVILLIYNLPPWYCMKQKYMMLSLLISGPKQPRNDIDVYLSLLIEDLKRLWENDIEVYDGFRDECFTLKAMLYGTINDFPAYGNLSGYSIKGQCACPICSKNTDYIRLEYCHKNVFMGHRRWLPRNHPFRKMKKAFNGSCDERRCPYSKSGEQIFEEVKDIKTTFGKPFAKDISSRGWKKMSIFFELPYWKSLHVRHFVDVMHVEKNVCGSVVGTLLNIEGKKRMVSMQA